MATQLPILLILAVLSFTAVVSPSCFGPPGPIDAIPGVPPPVCNGPCYCPSDDELANCPGGLVTGVCGCRCSRCAKQENRCCGGWLNYQGKCDVGLICRQLPSPPSGPGPRPGGGRRSIPGGIPNPGLCKKI